MQSWMANANAPYWCLYCLNACVCRHSLIVSALYGQANGIKPQFGRRFYWAPFWNHAHHDCIGALACCAWLGPTMLSKVRHMNNFRLVWFVFFFVLCSVCFVASIINYITSISFKRDKYPIIAVIFVCSVILYTTLKLFKFMIFKYIQVYYDLTVNWFLFDLMV